MRDAYGAFRKAVRISDFQTVRTIIYRSFSPREARFLVFLKDNPDIPREAIAFDIFPELIPFCRREYVLKQYDRVHLYILKKNKQSHMQIDEALRSYGATYPHPPLLRSEFVISYSYNE